MVHQKAGSLSHKLTVPLFIMVTVAGMNSYFAIDYAIGFINSRDKKDGNRKKNVPPTHHLLRHR